MQYVILFICPRETSHYYYSSEMEWNYRKLCKFVIIGNLTVGQLFAHDARNIHSLVRFSLSYLVISVIIISVVSADFPASLQQTEPVCN